MTLPYELVDIIINQLPFWLRIKICRQYRQEFATKFDTIIHSVCDSDHVYFTSGIRHTRGFVWRFMVDFEYADIYSANPEVYEYLFVKSCSCPAGKKPKTIKAILRQAYRMCASVGNASWLQQFRNRLVKLQPPRIVDEKIYKILRRHNDLPTFRHIYEHGCLTLNPDMCKSYGDKLYYASDDFVMYVLTETQQDTPKFYQRLDRAIDGYSHIPWGVGMYNKLCMYRAGITLAG